MTNASFAQDESVPPGDDPRAERIERLMDAIDCIKADEREEARRILRELIRQDSNFEDAWLWMSVAVDTLDQTSICLDNVLRVNPGNAAAAAALHNLRIPQMDMERRRARLRMIRDVSNGLLWVLVAFVLMSGLCAISTVFSTTMMNGARSTLRTELTITAAPPAAIPSPAPPDSAPSQ
jgi:hypothetical protein